MVVILPEDRRYAEWGQAFGPLAEGIGSLVGSKINQVRARNAFRAANVPEAQAEAMSRLPQQTRQAALQDIYERQGYGGAQQGQQQGGQAQGGGIDFMQALSQSSPQTQQRFGALQAMAMGRPQTAPQVAPGMNALQGAYQGGQGIQNYQTAMAGGRPQEQLAQAQGGLAALQKAQQASALGYPQQQQQLQQQRNQPGQPGQVVPRQPGEAPSPVNAPQLQTGAPAVRGTPAQQQPGNPLLGPNPKYARQAAQDQREERMLQLKEQAEQRKAEDAREKVANEQVGEELRSIRKRAVEGREIKQSYKHLIKLAESGELRTPQAHALLEKLGISALGQNEATQLANKEIARLAQGIGSSGLTGARGATNYMEQLFQRSLPSLYNTPKGIVGIARLNLLNLEKNDILEKYHKKVLKENNGRITIDMPDRIDELATPEILDLYEKQIDQIDKDLGIGRGNRYRDTATQNVGRGPDQVGNPPAGGQDGDWGGYLGTVPRALEEAAGFPGNVVAGGAALGRWVAGENNPVGQAFKTVEEYAPTSNAIRRNVTQPLTGEYFEPKTPNERLAQDFTSTAASLATGGGPLKQAIGLAVGATAAQQAASALGFGALGQGVAKAIPILAGSVFGGRAQIRAVEEGAYNAAREAAGNTSVNFSKPQEYWNKFKSYVNSIPGDDKTKKVVIDAIEKLENSPGFYGVSKGEGLHKRVAINDIHEAKKGVNRLLADPSIPDASKVLLKRASAPLHRALEDFGKEVPAFGKAYNIAEELHKGLSTQSSLTKFLNQHLSLQNAVKNPILSAALGGAAWTASKAAGVLPTAVGLGAAVATKEGSKLADLVMASSIARKHYLDLVRAQQTGLLNEAGKALRGLDKEADKFF